MEQTIKKLIKNYKNRFLLKLVSWGDADMINLYDENNKFILPPYLKAPLGKRYNQLLKNFSCNFAIPFSSMHKYTEELAHMNEYVASISDHKDGFTEENGYLLPAYIIWDLQKRLFKNKTEENKCNFSKPGSFGILFRPIR